MVLRKEGKEAKNVQRGKNCHSMTAAVTMTPRQATALHTAVTAALFEEGVTSSHIKKLQV